MNKGFVILLMLLVFVLCITVSSFGFEFSADIIFTADGQKTYGKMYSNADNFRMEITKPEHMITITRMDKKVVWNIMPSEKIYLEMPTLKIYLVKYLEEILEIKKISLVEVYLICFLGVVKENKEVRI